jgi:hypothetical protein
MAFTTGCQAITEIAVEQWADYGRRVSYAEPLPRHAIAEAVTEYTRITSVWSMLLCANETAQVASRSDATVNSFFMNTPFKGSVGCLIGPDHGWIRLLDDLPHFGTNDFPRGLCLLHQRSRVTLRIGLLEKSLPVRLRRSGHPW